MRYPVNSGRKIYSFTTPGSLTSLLSQVHGASAIMSEQVGIKFEMKDFGQRIILATLIVFLSGCTPPAVTLVNPRTGDTRHCSNAEVGLSSQEHVQELRMKSCVYQWKTLGYIETENLTPEQRSRLAAKHQTTSQ